MKIINYFSSIAVATCIAGYGFAQAPPIQWQKNYGGTNTDVAQSVRPTSDGGFIVAGFTESNNVDVTGHIGEEDFWVVKLNGNGAIQWKKIYGGSNDDRCYEVLQTGDGGYILAGTTNSTNGHVTGNHGAFDMWVVKLNSSGNLQWQRTLGGSDDEAAYSISQSPDGTYVVVGNSKSDDIAGNMNNGDLDYYIVKLRANGSIIWQRLYGGDSPETARSVTTTTNGEILVAGHTESDDDDVNGNKGSTDYWVLRLRQNGNLTWARTYGGTSRDNAFSVTTTNDGNLVVAGETESNNYDVPDNNGSSDYWVIKLAFGTGNILWSKNYGGETADNARFIRRTADGGYVIAGESESESHDVSDNYGSDDYWIVKINSAGNIQWEKNYGGSSKDYATCIIPLQNGGYIISGASESESHDVSNNYDNEDYWVVRLAPASGAALTKAITEKSDTEISVVPVPTKDYIQLTSEEKINRIEIYSQNGLLMKQDVMKDANQKIGVFNLQPGMYYIKAILANGGTASASFLKE